jgi:FkbM family methyltransferase
MKTFLKAAYVRLSNLLHETPLRRVKWIGVLHNRLYGLLGFGHSVSSAGFRLEVDPRDRTIAKKITLYGGYEPFLQSVLIDCAEPGTIVVDVGANVGLHTLPLAKRVGASGRVIAFEPDPENYRLLLRNIEVNGLASRVTVHRLGLSDKTGAAPLYQCAENRGGLSLRAQNVETSGASLAPVEVQLVIGDDVLPREWPISLVKIDVEGAEPLVIKGMERTLTDHREAVLAFEFSPLYVESFGVDAETFLAGLSAAGYEISCVDEGSKTVSKIDIGDLIEKIRRSRHPVNLIAAHTTREAAAARAAQAARAASASQGEAEAAVA